MSYKLLLTVIASFMTLPALAVLGGNPPFGAHPEIFQIDARSGNQSRVCTATAIAPNVLLTAAHCFDHIPQGNFQLFVDGTQVHEKFQLRLHPNYKSRQNSKNYLRQSNFDVAVLKFEDFRFSTYKILELKPQTDPTIGQFLGIGMRHLIWSRADGLKQSQRGQLQEASMPISKTPEGLFLSKPTQLTFKDNSEALPLAGPGQILRSDSGGPLIIKGLVAGIARNYFFKDRLGGIRKTEIQLQLESQFTNLSHKKVSQFLKAYITE